MKRVALRHEFVETIPAEPEEGILYVSIRYRTAVHLCACGCGNKVVTPIKPPKWHLTYDGATVSLSPSIGNWQLPCRSHYWIRDDKVRWDAAWSEAEIEAGRERDARELRKYYSDRQAVGVSAAAAGPGAVGRPAGLLRRAWQKLWRRH